MAAANARQGPPDSTGELTNTTTYCRTRHKGNYASIVDIILSEDEDNTSTKMTFISVVHKLVLEYFQNGRCKVTTDDAVESHTLENGCLDSWEDGKSNPNSRHEIRKI